MGERRGNLRAADLEQARRLLQLAVVNIHHDFQSIDDLIDTARHLQCQVYDAAYVILADDVGMPLLTLDGGMAQACLMRGVECDKP